MAPRSEEDLRAAFRLAARDAPATEDVLARLRAAQTRDLFAPSRAKRSRMRQWLPAAAVAAVVIAIAVPIGFVVAHSNGGAQSSSASDSFAKAPENAAGAASSAASGEIAEPGGATGGPVNTAPLNPIVPGATAPSRPVCTPAELTLTLAWTKAGDRLTGVVTATNHSQVGCDLNVKPAIYPLDATGDRLPIQNVESDEGRVGPALVRPGASATATVTWFSWCGAAPSSKAEIDWGQGAATAVVTGPTAPGCSSNVPNTISAEWFNPQS